MMNALYKMLRRNILKYNNIIYYVFVFILVISSYNIAIQKDWHLSTHGSNHNLFSMIIGGAISSMKYDLNGYTGYTKIYQLFRDNGTIDDHVLHTALKLNDVTSEGIYTMGPADVGQLDFCRIAFALFGYSVSSLLHLYYILLIFSVMLYLAAFNKDSSAKVLLLFFLLSFLMITPAAARVGQNIGVIYNYRFMSLLAILPIIHIILAWKTESNSLPAYVLLTAQSIIIAFVYHNRSSAIWIYILVISIMFINAVIIVRGRKAHMCVDPLFAKDCSVWTTLVKFVKKTGPVFIVLCVFVTMKIIIANTMSPLYEERGEGAHLVWHSMYLGLAIHPDIREKYTDERALQENVQRTFHILCDKSFIANHFFQGERIKGWVRSFLCDNPEFAKYLIAKNDKLIGYRPNDQDGYSAAFKWLAETGRSEYELLNYPAYASKNFTWFATHGNRNVYPEPDSSDVKMTELSQMRFGEYEKVINDVVKKVLITHPLQVMELTFIIKPVRFLYYYLKYYLIFNIKFLIFAIITIAYCILLLRQSHADNFQSYIRVLLLVLLFSMVLPLVIYPSEFTMSDNVLIFTMCIFCFFMSSTLSISRKYR